MLGALAHRVPHKSHSPSHRHTGAFLGATLAAVFALRAPFACTAHLLTHRIFPAIPQLLEALLCSGVPQPRNEVAHDTGHYSMVNVCPPSWAQRHKALVAAETGD